MQLDSNNPPERVVFDGAIYKRMGGKRRYYLEQREPRKGAKGLHVAIWEAANGPVPKGCELHHKNGDTFDCRIENLECLPIGVHRRMAKRRNREEQIALLERIRPLAAAWHKSKAGREWHRHHAFESIQQPGRKRVFKIKGTKPCAWCGQLFEFRIAKKRFCQPKCQWDATRARLRSACG